MKRSFAGLSSSVRSSTRRCTLALAVPDVVTVYTVKAGDTLWGIASDHSISVSDLQQLNEDLFPRRPRCGASPKNSFSPDNTIFPGDKLYLPRHAEIQQEPHPTQFHHDSAAQNVSFDDAQAVAVASTGDVVTCRTELAPVADDRTQRIPGVGLAVLGFMGLFTVGYGILRRSSKDVEPQRMAAVPMSLDQMNENITAYSIDDVTGRYIKSGFAVPSEFHNTTVRSAASRQSSAATAEHGVTSAAVVREAQEDCAPQVDDHSFSSMHEECQVKECRPALRREESTSFGAAYGDINQRS